MPTDDDRLAHMLASDADAIAKCIDDAEFRLNEMQMRLEALRARRSSLLQAWRESDRQPEPTESNLPQIPSFPSAPVRPVTGD